MPLSGRHCFPTQHFAASRGRLEIALGEGDFVRTCLWLAIPDSLVAIGACRYTPRPRTILMAQIREIKKRMVAVGSIARITKTMQMIANAKFAAAMGRAKAMRPFTQTIRHMVSEVAAAAGDIDHPLISGPAESPRKELLLIISSDRGLCGAYNGHVFRVAGRHINELKTATRAFDIDISGKKAVAFCKFRQIPVINRFTFGDKPKFDEVNRLATRYIDYFTAGKYEAVRVAYMRFESNARQVPEVMQLLPLKPPAADKSATTGGQPKAESRKPKANYEFSPSSEELLADLLPMTVKASLFQAFNDAVVSEQIMRMVAMKAATENAKDLGKTLRRQYNRARQSRITTELTEIVSGAAALE
jgi:F-type H+-transporting ATPase subunit gamma